MTQKHQPALPEATRTQEIHAGDDPMTFQDDEKHRMRVNGIAAIFILFLILLALWVVNLFHEQEKLQRCLDSRRTNCFDVPEPPREGIRLPAH